MIHGRSVEIDGNKNHNKDHACYLKMPSHDTYQPNHSPDKNAWEFQHSPGVPTCTELQPTTFLHQRLNRVQTTVAINKKLLVFVIVLVAFGDFVGFELDLVLHFVVKVDQKDDNEPD